MSSTPRTSSPMSAWAAARLLRSATAALARCRDFRDAATSRSSCCSMARPRSTVAACISCVCFSRTDRSSRSDSALSSSAFSRACTPSSSCLAPARMSFSACSCRTSRDDCSAASFSLRRSEAMRSIREDMLACSISMADLDVAMALQFNFSVSIAFSNCCFSSEMACSRRSRSFSPTARSSITSPASALALASCLSSCSASAAKACSLAMAPTSSASAAALAASKAVPRSSVATEAAWAASSCC
mmetsp:Transcript_30515/g.86275  ORF Transcript_30515/g.86275 Transcript_30515/m.86275 type:complete len:245 (+) Transcript_30515:2831-3565(+)